MDLTLIMSYDSGAGMEYVPYFIRNKPEDYDISDEVAILTRQVRKGFEVSNCWPTVVALCVVFWNVPDNPEALAGAVRWVDEHPVGRTPDGEAYENGLVSRPVAVERVELMPFVMCLQGMEDLA